MLTNRTGEIWGKIFTSSTSNMPDRINHSVNIKGDSPKISITDCVVWVLLMLYIVRVLFGSEWIVEREGWSRYPRPLEHDWSRPSHWHLCLSGGTTKNIHKHPLPSSLIFVGPKKWAESPNSQQEIRDSVPWSNFYWRDFCWNIWMFRPSFLRDEFWILWDVPFHIHRVSGEKNISVNVFLFLLVNCNTDAKVFIFETCCGYMINTTCGETTECF